MANFRVGQKVVCVNDETIIDRELLQRKVPYGLNKYVIYTCLWVYVDEDGDEVLFIKELNHSFLSIRFRPLDYDFVEEVIKQVKPKELVQ